MVIVPFSAPTVQQPQDPTGATILSIGQGTSRFGASLLGSVLQGNRRVSRENDQLRQQRANFQEALQDQENNARVKEADGLASDAIRGALQDPERGYLNRLGKGALDERKNTIVRMEDHLRRIGETLTNPTQRQMWEERRSERMRGAQSRVDAHYVKQSRAYSLAQTEARIGSAGRDALDARFDAGMATEAERLEQFELDKSKMIGEVETLAEDQGLPPEVVEAAILNATTDLHTAVFDKLLAEQGTRVADDYLKENKDEISAERRGVLDSRMEVSKRSDRVQAHAVAVDDRLLQIRADRIAQSQQPREGEDIVGPLLVPRQASPSAVVAYRASYLLEAQAMLDEDFADGKINDQERRLIFGEIARRDKLRRSTHATEELQELRKAKQALIDNQLMSVDDYAKVEPDGYDILKRGGHVGTLRDFQDSGQRQSTNLAARLRLDQMDPAKLQGMPLAEFKSYWIDKLNPQDMKYAVAQWAAANNMRRDSHGQLIQITDEQTSLFTKKERITEEARQVGITDDLGIVRYKAQAEKLVRAYERDVLGGKRKVNDEEFQSLLDQAQKDVVLVGNYFPDKRAVISLTKDEREHAYVFVNGRPQRIAAVDALVRDRMIEDFLEAGRTPTESAIVHNWVRLGKPKDVKTLLEATIAEGSRGNDAIGPPPIIDPVTGQLNLNLDDELIGVDITDVSGVRTAGAPPSSITNTIGGSVTQLSGSQNLDVSRFVGDFEGPVRIGPPRPPTEPPDPELEALIENMNAALEAQLRRAGVTHRTESVKKMIRKLRRPR